MEYDYEWHHIGFWFWVVFRIIFAIIVISVILGIVFNLNVTPIVTIIPNWPSWFWNLIGILFLLWLLGWIFRWPLHQRYREERILRRRYARGEITRTQYLRMMKDLQESNRKNR